MYWFSIILETEQSKDNHQMEV